MIKLGDNPATQVSILEVADKPADPKALSGVNSDVKIQTSPATSTSKPPNIDAEILETPQGKPVRPTTSEHFGKNLGSSYLEYERGRAASEEGRAVGNFIGGSLIGLWDAFTNNNSLGSTEETKLIGVAAQEDTGVGIGYEAGKALGEWAEDRFKDINKWANDLFHPVPFPSETDKPKWDLPDFKLPDFKLPDFKLPDFKLPNFDFPEPNFEKKDDDYNFDEYKKKKPQKPKIPEQPKELDEDFPQETNSPNIKPKINDSSIPHGIDFDLPPGEYNISFTAKCNWEQGFVQLIERPSHLASYYYNPQVNRGSWAVRLSGLTVKNPKKLVLVEHDLPPSYDPSTRTRANTTKQFSWQLDADSAQQYGYSLPRSSEGFLRFVYNTNCFEFSFYSSTRELLEYNEGANYFKEHNFFGNSVIRIKDVTPRKVLPPPEIEPPIKKKKKKVEKCLFDEEKIKKLIRSLIAKIEIPLVTAEKTQVDGVEKWIPKINRTQIEVIAIDENTAASMALVYRKIAEIQIDLIKRRNADPPIAVIPEWWQTRIGAERPQLVAIYAEQLKGKLGRTRWPISIPHYNESIKKPKLPSYVKGQWEGILTLKDNSKLVVNAVSQGETESVLQKLSTFIKPQMLLGATSKVGLRKGAKLKQCRVVATSVRYFSTGQKNTNPDWVNSLI